MHFYIRTRKVKNLNACTIDCPKVISLCEKIIHVLGNFVEVGMLVV